MKRAWMFAVFVISAALASDDTIGRQPAPSEVVSVATALDHLTVIEFGEPVTLAAAGSPSFQIERHEDKVFIKPLKSGASTDLFVWTASRHFTFELEPPGEVKKMNSFINVRLPAPQRAPDTQEQLNQTADMMFSRAFLGAERVQSGGIKDANDRVTVRIENVLQSKTTLYIHYSVINRTDRPYRVLPPLVVAAIAERPGISPVSLSRTQIDQATLRKLGDLKERSLALARSEIGKQDIAPGEATEGVAAIRDEVTSPTIVQLKFGPDGTRPVQAVMVF